MKYKVGDKVKLKFKEGLDELKRQVGDLYIHPDAYKNAGSEQTILECNDGFYRYDASSMFWHESLFEGLVEESLDNDMKEHQRMCDEIMVIQGIEPIEAEMEQIIHCPEGYIFKDENGNVINATKIVLEKKKNEYPKTYDECARIMRVELWNCLWGEDATEYEEQTEDLMDAFIRLKVCRDAYWKIAGEEMGLDGPWEPDWLDDDTKKYVITSTKVFDTFGGLGYINYILTFPTEEMRDAFYENFKEEIELVKELL